MYNKLIIREFDSILFNHLLKKKGSTQKEMAEKLNINEKTFSLYKSNYAKMREEETKSIADYLGTSIDELWKPKPSEAASHIDYRLKYIELLESSLDDYKREFAANRALLTAIYGIVEQQKQISKEIAAVGKPKDGQEKIPS